MSEKNDNYKYVNNKRQRLYRLKRKLIEEGNKKAHFTIKKLLLIDSCQLYII